MVREHAVEGEHSATVHVLVAGHALCGTLSGFPGAWPLGHWWVSFKDRGTVTCGCKLCGECGRKAEELERKP